VDPRYVDKLVKETKIPAGQAMIGNLRLRKRKWPESGRSIRLFHWEQDIIVRGVHHRTVCAED
jgi:hypothetical protein